MRIILIGGAVLATGVCAASAETKVPFSTAVRERSQVDGFCKRLWCKQKSLGIISPNRMPRPKVTDMLEY
jgi:hypothetical protein